MKLTVGSRYASQVCTTEVIVVRAGAAEVALECGGVPMTAPAERRAATAAADRMAGSLLGKRYVDDDGDLEVLVVKAGEGSLSLNGKPLSVQAPRILPSSD